MCHTKLDNCSNVQTVLNKKPKFYLWDSKETDSVLILHLTRDIHKHLKHVLRMIFEVPSLLLTHPENTTTAHKLQGSPSSSEEAHCVVTYLTELQGMPAQPQPSGKPLCSHHESAKARGVLPSLSPPPDCRPQSAAAKGPRRPQHWLSPC